VWEVAQCLRLHEKTVYGLVERGALPHIRLGVVLDSPS
jgi:excisionase family DNA binding protein